jgi:flagellar M-ring protein FliF
MANLFTQIRQFWERLKPVQRIVLIAVTVVLLVAVPLLITWATAPTYSVAFANLSETDSASIVDKLKASNINYQMRGTTTILVETDKVYEVRLTMAKEGLPNGGTVGFELFSGNTLGMTEFTQRVNYQRALEGELERTIASIDAVKAVRVHIVTPEKKLLESEESATTASVTIQENAGKQLDAATVRAITLLVSSSVEGLSPDNVVVVDTVGNLLASGNGKDGSGLSISQVDDRRAAEQASASEIQKKVRTLLEQVLGPNRSVVQVSVNMDWTERDITRQTFDPTPQAVRSSQITNESYATNGELSGIPGASTNLPTPVATAVSSAAGALVYQRNEATTNYEISSVQTHEIVKPGQMARISLSVLVDGVEDPEQLGTLQNAIAAAAGIDTARGDVISVQNLAFDRTYNDQQTQDLAQSELYQLYIQIAEIAAVVLVTIFLLWYISRVLRNLRMASVEVWTPVLGKPAQEAMLAGSTPTAGQMMGGGGSGMATGGWPEMGAQQQASFFGGQQPPSGPLTGPQIPSSQQMPTQQPAVTVPLPQPKFERASKPSAEEEQMQRVLARMAEENPAGIAEIIQLWMNQDKQSNG